MDAVAVPQALRTTVGAGRDARDFHHLHDTPPGGHARPRPQEPVGMPFAAPLGLPERVHEVEVIERARRHRHRPVDALTALFEAADGDRLRVQVDPRRDELEGFGNPAARIMQDGAEGAHLARRVPGGLEEGAAFVAGEIEAAAFGVDQAHFGGGGH